MHQINFTKIGVSSIGVVKEEDSALKFMSLTIIVYTLHFLQDHLEEKLVNERNIIFLKEIPMNI